MNNLPAPVLSSDYYALAIIEELRLLNGSLAQLVTVLTPAPAAVVEPVATVELKEPAAAVEPAPADSPEVTPTSEV